MKLKSFLILLLLISLALVVLFSASASNVSGLDRWDKRSCIIDADCGSSKYCAAGKCCERREMGCGGGIRESSYCDSAVTPRG